MIYILIFLSVLGVYLLVDSFTILQDLSPDEDPELYEEFCKTVIHKAMVAVGVTVLFILIKFFFN